MTLYRLFGGALGVFAWFAAWRWMARRLTQGTAPLTLLNDAIEALLLTLFAALWFASLGHGGWWILFAVLGLLIDGPVRARHRVELPVDPAPWRPLALGTLRILGAGAILSLTL